VSVSQPFEGSPSQLVNPALQAPITHEPVEHTALAFAYAHAWAHAPQLAMSARTSVSQPLATLPSQLPKPALHERAHAPAAHPGIPFAPDGHTAPQLPQFAGSVCVAAQRVPQIVG
jgi:hypothetical protein